MLWESIGCCGAMSPQDAVRGYVAPGVFSGRTFGSPHPSPPMRAEIELWPEVAVLWTASVPHLCTGRSKGEHDLEAIQSQHLVLCLPEVEGKTGTQTRNTFEGSRFYMGVMGSVILPLPPADTCQWAGCEGNH